MRSTNGFTFGGYAAAAWNTTSALIPAAGSFVFWVENPQGRAPGCLDCVNPAHALGGVGSYGPLFDGMHGCVGIHIGSSTTNYSQPSAAYPDTTGLGVALFTGVGTNNPVEDYEVWAAT